MPRLAALAPGAPGEGPRCRICTAASTPGWTMCTSCRDVARVLGRPPLPVRTLAVVTHAHPLYRALRQYKSGEHAVARRQAAVLATFVAETAPPHLPGGAAGGLDATVVVPSGGGRPPPHPLTEVVSRSGVLPRLLDALAARERELAHRRPALAAYRPTADVTGRRVLLIDDVFTTGAHLQSAAGVLRDAGAALVVPLVLARYVRTGDVDGAVPSGNRRRERPVTERRVRRS